MSAQFGGNLVNSDTDKKVQADFCTNVHMSGKEKSTNIAGYKPFTRPFPDCSKENLKTTLAQFLQDSYYDLIIKFSFNQKLYTLHKNDKKNSLEPFIQSNVLPKGHDPKASNHQRNPSSDSPQESPKTPVRSVQEPQSSSPKLSGQESPTLPSSKKIESPKVAAGTPPRKISGLDLTVIKQGRVSPNQNSDNADKVEGGSPFSAAVQTTPPGDKTPPGAKTPPQVPPRRAVSGDFSFSPEALQRTSFTAPKLGQSGSGPKPPLASPPIGNRKVSDVAATVPAVQAPQQASGEDKPKPRPPAGPAPKRPGSASPKLPEGRTVMLSTQGQNAGNNTNNTNSATIQEKPKEGNQVVTTRRPTPPPSRPAPLAPKKP